ncbi:MAG: O-antigen ligase family protein [Planctomycetia bacterium]|nr:O-antigen ligase family protein [Planctomycetia bacterium]
MQSSDQYNSDQLNKKKEQNKQDQLVHNEEELVSQQKEVPVLPLNRFDGAQENNDSDSSRRSLRRKRSRSDFNGDFDADFNADSDSSRRSLRRKRSRSDFDADFDSNRLDDTEDKAERSHRHHRKSRLKELIREKRQKKAQELFEDSSNLENLSLQSFRSPFPNINYWSTIIGRYSMIGTILLAPWLYGGATLFSQLILYYGILISITSALIMFVTSSYLDRQKHSFGKFGLTTILLILGLLLGIFQLIPFSQETLQQLAPRSYELRNNLILNDLEGLKSNDQVVGETTESDNVSESKINNHEIIQTWDSVFLTKADQENISEWPACFSIHPNKTRRQLALLFMVVAAFISGGILFNTPSSRRWLWLGIAINAFFLTFFSITMYLRPIGIYKKVWAGCQFGPYVNRNNLSGYLCICFGVVFGLWVEQLLAMRRVLEKENDQPVSSIYQRSLYYRIRDRFYQTLDLINRKVFLGIVALGVIFAGILMLMSRGATLALIFSFLIGTTILLQFRNFRQYILLFLGVVLIGVLTLFWLGRNESVSQRLESLTSLETEENAIFQDVRLTTWSNAFKTIDEYDWRGSGLGTFAVANRNHDKALAVNKIFRHAENQLIETLVEAGIIGTVLMILEFVTIIVICIFCLRKKRSDMTFAFGLGMIVVLLGQMIAGFADFGMYLMANALLMAVLCGSFVNQSRRNNDNLKLFNQTRSFCWFHFLMIFLFLIGGISGSLWGLQEITKSYELEKVMKSSPLPNNSETSLSFVDSLIEKMELATQKSFDSSDAHLLLAKLYLIKNHILQREEYLKNNPQSSLENAWLQSDIILPLRIIFQLKQTKQEISADEIQQIFRDQGNINQAIRHFLLARRICPIQPEVHYQLGYLLPLIQNVPFEQLKKQVELCAKRAEGISQYEPRVYYQNGLLFFILGDEPQAFQTWQKSLTLSSFYMIPILNHLGARIKPRNVDSIVDRIFPDSFDLLNKCLNIMLVEQVSKTANIQQLLSKSTAKMFDSVSESKTTPEISFSLLIQKKQAIIIDAILHKMEKVLTAIPENDRNAEYYFCCGILDARRKKYDDSANHFEKAIQMDSQQGRFYYEYARMLNEQDKLSQCVEMYEKSLECSPGHKLYIKRLEQAKARLERQKMPYGKKKSQEKKEAEPIGL